MDYVPSIVNQESTWYFYLIKISHDMTRT